MKKFVQWAKQSLASLKIRLLKPPTAAAAASLAVMAAALLVPPLIGMADNGDFSRTITGQGIYKLDRYEDDSFFDYFSSRYGLFEYYNDQGTSLISSQNLYIQAALLLNRLFGPDKTVFDIRFLAIFLIAELAVGIYLLVDYAAFGKSRFQGCLLGAAGVLLFADTAYTAYFNSFYAEGLVYVSTLLLVGSALLLTQKRYPPYLLLFSILLNGVILIFTKQQNATEGAALFLLCLFVGILFREESRAFRRLAVSGAVLMAVLGVVMYAIIPSDFVRVNQYHAMTRGALMTGEDPEETLAEFDIDGQFSVLDGSIYFEKYPAVFAEDEQLRERFYEKYSFVSLSVYYLTHPAELAAMLDKAVGEGYKIRPAAQGNFERSAGREPGAQTDFFTLYSSLKAKYIPNTLGFVVIWLLIVCGVSLRDRKKLMILLCTVLMGLIQIGTSIIGAGDADLAKHIFQYNVSFDLVSYICFAPPLTALLVRFFKWQAGLVRKRKGMAAALGAVLLCAGGLTVEAAGQDGSQPAEEAYQGVSLSTEAAGQDGVLPWEPAVRRTACVIVRAGQEPENMTALAEACGLEAVSCTELENMEGGLAEAAFAVTTSAKSLEAVRKAGIQAVCIGSDFSELPGLSVKRYPHGTVRFTGGGYEGEAEALESFGVLTGGQGITGGTLRLPDGQEAPFAGLAEDGNYYIPCYAESNLGAQILLGEVLRKLAGMEEPGKTYFLLDEVYAFSDLKKLCGWADLLYENGIPFAARIMPLYDNLDYPAFSRFTETLKYMRSRGGEVVIHDPLVREQNLVREPLEDKMKRFVQALSKAGIDCGELPGKPLMLSAQELSQVRTDTKSFGSLPFDMAVRITPELTDEDFALCLERVNRAWLSFTDLQRKSGGYLYAPEEAEEEFAYRGEREEAAFSAFFSKSDRFLTIVVGISLAVLAGLLLIGRRWYRRKFYR